MNIQIKCMYKVDSSPKKKVKLHEKLDFLHSKNGTNVTSVASGLSTSISPCSVTRNSV